MEQWISQLPKTLWELGTEDSVATEVCHTHHILRHCCVIDASSQTILRFLLRLFQLRSAFVHSEVCHPPLNHANNHRLRCSAQVLDAVRSRLVPYFIISHPTRGALPGPYTKLERLTLRALALDVVATLFRLGGVEERLDNAVLMAVAGTTQEQYWVEITCVSRPGPP